MPAPRYVKQTIAALTDRADGFDPPQGYRILRAELTTDGDYWRIIYEREVEK